MLDEPEDGGGTRSFDTKPIGSLFFLFTLSQVELLSLMSALIDVTSSHGCFCLRGLMWKRCSWLVFVCLDRLTTLACRASSM